MDAYWVGIRGDLTSEQLATLHGDGLAAVGQLRQSIGRYGEAPWETLRSFIRAPGADAAEAKRRVADLLDLDADDLVAYDAGMFT